MSLLESFKQYIRKENLFQQNDLLLLAVSGGIDSVTLCELCKQAGFHFIIAHCNFQLRGEFSSRDENFVKALAQKYKAPYFVKTFDTLQYAATSKKSIEEAARHLRYEWFYQLVNAGDETIRGEPANAYSGSSTARYILTGHHADDNIETVTMNFFRGTGIKGLRGILPKQGKIIRPLLFARRRQLEAFVKENSLEFTTDHTNSSNEYTRNRFRNNILPLINENYPEASENILRNIQRFKDTESLFQQAIHFHKTKLIEQTGNEVHIPVLKLMKTAPLSTVFYEILKEYSFTAHQTEEAIALMKSESGKYIQSPTHRIVKNRKWLIISPIKTIEASHILIENNKGIIEFAEGRISIKETAESAFSISNSQLTAQLDFAKITFPLMLRRWKQGDYFYPLGMQKKKKVSRFFIDQKLSLTQKEKVWVVEMDKKIVWVVGLRIDDRFKITGSTRNILTIDYVPK